MAAPPLAQLVDVSALLSVIVASLVAGGGLVLGFSISIFSATRAAELRRAGGAAGAALLTLVAVVAGAACVGLVALGIYIIAS